MKPFLCWAGPWTGLWTGLDRLDWTGLECELDSRVTAYLIVHMYIGPVYIRIYIRTSHRAIEKYVV